MPARTKHGVIRSVPREGHQMRHVILVGLFIVAAGNALGATGCDTYVTQALDGAREVRFLECGYDLAHPQWSTDANIHRRWCRFANQESVDRESRVRESQLQRCRLCRGYTNAAMTAIRDNRRFRCGFTGPAWVENSSSHFGWCMGLSSQTVTNLFWVLIDPSLVDRVVASETGARNNAIEQCKVQRTAEEIRNARQPPQGRPSQREGGP